MPISLYERIVALPDSTIITPERRPRAFFTLHTIFTETNLIIPIPLADIEMFFEMYKVASSTSFPRHVLLFYRFPVNRIAPELPEQKFWALSLPLREEFALERPVY